MKCLVYPSKKQNIIMNEF